MSTVTPNLGLTLPAVHDEDWGVPTLNEDFTLIDDFAATVVLYAPTVSQTVTQPASTYFNFNYPIVFLATNPALRFGTAADLWDSALTRTGAGAFTLDSNVPANAAATLKLTVLNALTGLQINSAAPSGHILIGNGTNYVDGLLSSIAFYQTVQANGASRTQRPRLNFLPRITAVDNSGNTSTDIDIANTAVTPGSYTKASLTVDQQGRLTAAANGVGVTATVSSDLVGSRSFNTVFHNTSSAPLYISGNGQSNTGSSTADLAALIGPTSSPTSQVWANHFTATSVGGLCGFQFMVPAGWFYEVTMSGDVGIGGSSHWFETSLS